MGFGERFEFEASLVSIVLKGDSYKDCGVSENFAVDCRMLTCLRVRIQGSRAESRVYGFGGFRR